VQSLFDERIPWAYEGPNSEPFRMPHANEHREEPHPKNAQGPFYVVHGWCIACGVPHSLAPELIAAPEDQRDSHCFFRKQPKTPEEIEQAIKAIAGSCCGAFRYAGSDKAIKEKLREGAGDDAIVSD